MEFGERITYKLDDHVAVLTINGVGPLNILDKPFYAGYNDALVEFREDDEARVLVIRSGNPNHFTAPRRRNPGFRSRNTKSGRYFGADATPRF